MYNLNMSIRKVLKASRLGTYCELVAALSFISEDHDVAFPLGNQAGWDLLVDIDGKWQRAQVRTVAPLKGLTPALNLCRAGRSGKNRTGGLKPPFSAADMDCLIGVDPESGTMWMVPAAEFGIRKLIRLEERHLMQGSVVEPVLPRSRPAMSIEVRNRQNAKWGLLRAGIKTKMPLDRPAEITEENWLLTHRWLDGESYRIICDSFAISPMAIRERIIRVLARCGVSDLPDSFQKQNSYRRRRMRELRAERNAATPQGITV